MEFVEETIMPHSVKGLTQVIVARKDEFAFVDSLGQAVNYPGELVGGAVIRSKSGLVLR